MHAQRVEAHPRDLELRALDESFIGKPPVAIAAEKAFRAPAAPPPRTRQPRAARRHATRCCLRSGRLPWRSRSASSSGVAVGFFVFADRLSRSSSVAEAPGPVSEPAPNTVAAGPAPAVPAPAPPPAVATEKRSAAPAPSAARSSRPPARTVDSAGPGSRPAR